MSRFGSKFASGPRGTAIELIATIDGPKLEANAACASRLKVGPQVATATSGGDPPLGVFPEAFGIFSTRRPIQGVAAATSPG